MSSLKANQVAGASWHLMNSPNVKLQASTRRSEATVCLQSEIRSRLLNRAINKCKQEECCVALNVENWNKLSRQIYCFSKCAGSVEIEKHKDA